MYTVYDTTFSKVYALLLSAYLLVIHRVICNCLRSCFVEEEIVKVSRLSTFLKSTNFVLNYQLFTTTMLSLWRSGARHFSSSVARAEAVTYPFSKTALTPPLPTVPPPTRASVGKGLMEYLHKTIPSPEKQKMLTEFFSRRSPTQLMPGSVVTVMLEHAPTSFTGVLMSIRRRGIDTSFVLRNIVQRTGVEMQFFVNSPHLKEIKLIQKPRKGRMRRAKLFYLRTSPDKMSMLAAGKSS